MNKQEIIVILNDIFAEVFEDKSISINEDSNSDNISGWDSLRHIYLVVAIEKKFELNFTAEQIQEWHNVGDMAEFIEKNV